MTNNNLNGNEWKNWSIYIKESLKDVKYDVNGIKGDISSIKTEIALLKLKSGIWGLIGGAIPVAIAMTFYLIKTL